jgi:mRNA-degrading endonuclease toxin of MazEF toxin-antitoxin module
VAVDPQRLGECVGALARREMDSIDEALRVVLNLG